MKHESIGIVNASKILADTSQRINELVLVDKDHERLMEHLKRLCGAEVIILETKNRNQEIKVVGRDGDISDTIIRFPCSTTLTESVEDAIESAAIKFVKKVKDSKRREQK